MNWYFTSTLVYVQHQMHWSPSLSKPRDADHSLKPPFVVDLLICE